jgi:hypothetical protein
MQVRRKPEVLNAFAWHPSATAPSAPTAMPAWLAAAFDRRQLVLHLDGSLTVRSPEGLQHARPGDWIVHGPADEIRACTPAAFVGAYIPEGT